MFGGGGGGGRLRLISNSLTKVDYEEVTTMILSLRGLDAQHMIVDEYYENEMGYVERWDGWINGLKSQYISMLPYNQEARS